MAARKKAAKKKASRKKTTRKKQGYDARKDEQLGMTQGPERGKDMSMAGRRNVARSTRKPAGSFGFKKGGRVKK